MAKLVDTTEWQEFRVGDIVDAMERGTVGTLRGIDEGDTPVVAAGAFGQGVTGYFDITPFRECGITASCNGAGCGSVFYHDYPFACNGDAMAIDVKAPAKAQLFLSTILNQLFTSRFSYEEKLSPAKAADVVVKLPSKKVYLPDWRTLAEHLSLSLWMERVVSI